MSQPQVPDLLATSSKKPNAEPLCHVLVDDDGYTLTRYIEGVPRLFSSARFTFRPLGAVARSKVAAGQRDLIKEDVILPALCQVLSKRVINWNLVDQKGNQLPVSIESCLKIHPALLQRMLNVVIWATDPGDLDPDGKRLAEQLGDIPDLLGEEPTGVIEREQKNSQNR